MTRAIVTALALWVGAAAASAQEQPAPAPSPAPSEAADPTGQPAQTAPHVLPQVLTLDQERLFTDSAFGRRVQEELNARSRALAAENRRIEQELVAEERELTELRPTLSVEEFRARADAFDAKVERVRAEQDAKARALTAFLDAERQRFFAEMVPVLRDVVRARRALAILERRAVVIAADSIDVTDDVIAGIDARIGTGAAPQIPVDEDLAPEPAPVEGDAVTVDPPAGDEDN